MRLASSIAWRFIRKSKTQSILIVTGIAVGISVLIFIGSLINGLQTSLVDVAIGRIPQITIKNDSNVQLYLEKPEVLVEEIEKSNLDIKVVSPSLTVNVYLLYKEAEGNVAVRGIDLDRADAMYQLRDHMVSGRTFQEAQEIIIGKELADSLGVAGGERVKMVNAKGQTTFFTVVGIFDLKSKDLNTKLAFTALSQLQAAFELDNAVDTIDIQVGDVFAADLIAVSLKDVLKRDALEIRNWKEDNAQLLSGLNSQTVSTLIIQVFVLISVVLGIASILAISVMQKSKQIGILKAMGLNNVRSSQIFFLQGFYLSALGVLFGNLLGIGLIYGFLIGTGGSIIKITLDPVYLAVVSAVSLAFSGVAALVPARRSSKLDPVEVIKNG
jgi:lipoprotein-releasing system permease protein